MMKNKKESMSYLNQRIRLTAEDLSLLNGVSIKINTEYLKNLYDLIIYNIAEKARSGAEEIEIDLAYFGTIIIKRQIKSTTRKNNEPSFTFTYDFKPSSLFYKNAALAFDGNCDLPDLFADKYGEKLLNMYNSFLYE